MRYTLDDLIKVMAKLRNPDGGCPWDLKQSFDTIIPYTIEEAYEVADAVQNNDMPALREELGDLLFQSIYHAQMADESGHFNIHDVIHDVTDKMINRHPHVFGDESAKNAGEVDQIWDAQKSKEKPGERGSILDDVPKAFPALLRAHKLQKKAAKVGFEWPDITGVLDKLEEELFEVREAVASGNQAHIEDELGDLFFVMVNYARMNGLNAEELLRKGNEKFERRFRGLEAALKKQNISLKDASLEQMEDQWTIQKEKEKTG